MLPICMSLPDPGQKIRLGALSLFPIQRPILSPASPNVHSLLEKRLSKIMHISEYHTKQQQFWVETFYILSTLCLFFLPFKICASKMPRVKASRPSIRGHTASFVSHQWKPSLQVSPWIPVISLSNRKRSPIHKGPKCLWKLLVFSCYLRSPYRSQHLQGKEFWK